MDYMGRLFRAPSRRDYRIYVRQRAPIMHELLELGWSVKEVAAALYVSPTTVYNDLQREQAYYKVYVPATPRHEKLRRSLRRRTEIVARMANQTVTPQDLAFYPALVRCMAPYAP